MTDPNPFHRFAEAAAGHQLPVTIYPAETAPAAPATLTEVMTVDGVQLAVADRLLALAKIRDAHRTASRAANDRMHAAREQIEDRQMRIRRIQQADGGRPSVSSAADIAQLRAEIVEFDAARATATAEAEASSVAARDAEHVVRTALKFAREAGATIPVTLSQEAR